MLWRKQLQNLFLGCFDGLKTIKTALTDPSYIVSFEFGSALFGEVDFTELQTAFTANGDEISGF